MKIIHRKKCIMCGSKLQEKQRLRSFPIYMGVSSIEDSPVYNDKVFGACPKCGSVQLKQLIPLSVLYKKNHNSAIGKVWEKHHTEFCHFIKDVVYGNIIEIGGGNLKVANFLSQEKSIKKMTVFDKSFPFAKKSDKIILKKQFFNHKKIKEKPDAIIHTHLIEHLYNPLEEMKRMCDLLKKEGLMMFAAPLIDRMLKDNYTNAINFEHTFVLCEKMIENIMIHSGMRIISKKYFSDHAAFFIAKKEKSIDKAIIHNYPGHYKVFENFYNYHVSEVNRIRNLINNKGNVFIFGAHIFTQYLLGFGLDEHLFLNVLDNDPKKQNNYLYGSKLKVKSPKILKDLKQPVVVLKAAMYTEEIMKDILENINPNTRFIL